MRKITVFDTTLRDGEQAPGCTMNTREKLEFAKQLERLGVDVIEAGFPVASPDDFEAVSTIAREVRECTVAALCRCVQNDIDTAAPGAEGSGSSPSPCFYRHQRPCTWRSN